MLSLIQLLAPLLTANVPPFCPERQIARGDLALPAATNGETLGFLTPCLMPQRRQGGW